MERGKDRTERGREREGGDGERMEVRRRGIMRQEAGRGSGGYKFLRVFGLGVKARGQNRKQHFPPPFIVTTNSEGTGFLLSLELQRVRKSWKHPEENSFYPWEPFRIPKYQ